MAGPAPFVDASPNVRTLTRLLERRRAGQDL